jgi:hypothetical protein
VDSFLLMGVAEPRLWAGVNNEFYTIQLDWKLNTLKDCNYKISTFGSIQMVLMTNYGFLVTLLGLG